MVLPIVQYNDPILRLRGTPITKFDDELARLSKNMIETMHAAAGIGLAAQQVGLALKLCVLDLTNTDREFEWELDGTATHLDLIMPMILASPKVTILEGDDTIYEEGCLSFPGINGDIVRPDVIRVDFQDAQGTPHTMFCDGLLSRCVMHEVDHLNGVLFTDRMSKKVRKAIDATIKALAAKNREAKA